MAEREVEQWITVNGQHIPIYSGESKQDAINRHIAKQNEDKKNHDIEQNKKQADELNGKQEKSDADVLKGLGELKDAEDLNSFIKANMSNPNFKQYGREHGTDSVRQLYYEMKRQQEIKNLHEMKIEDAIAKVRESIPQRHIEGWFRQANSGHKPHIASEMFSNKGTLNAALNIAYHNYKGYVELQNIRTHGDEKPLSYKEWLTTPQTIYRGTSGQQTIQSDVFTSYTPDKKIAEDFAHGRNSAAGSSHGGAPKVESMTVRPMDTWGQLQTNAELEFMIPVKAEKFSR